MVLALWTSMTVHLYAFVENEPQKVSIPTSYPLPANKNNVQTVRVLLSKGVTAGTLSLNSLCRVTTIETNEPLEEITREKKPTIVPTYSGLRVGNVPFKIYGIRIKPRGRTFVFDGGKYRGDLVVIRERDMTLTFINYINLEEYLKGVLPKEVSPEWDLAALKAQAIASRTYALFQELSKQNKDYSLEKTVASQMYGGINSETAITTQAVNDTRGKILLYNNEIFPAYFHAACGGHTTRCDTVWNVTPHPSLKGVADPFCKRFKHYSWKWHATKDEIQNSLKNYGINTKSIVAIKWGEKDTSGRVTEFFVHSKNPPLRLNSNTFRLALGPQNVRSTKISSITEENNTYFFKGFGWGHGVGLCQWGAKAMADEGMTHTKILQYYFPKSWIVNVY